MKKNKSYSSSKRTPKATIDLKAKEIDKDKAKKSPEPEKIDRPVDKKPADKKQPKRSAAVPAIKAVDDKKSPFDDKKDDDKQSKTTTSDSENKKDNKAKARQSDRKYKQATPFRAPEPAAKSGGGFFSHLLASVVGAVMAVFGLSYASNQNMMPPGFELGGGGAVKTQIGQMESMITAAQQNATKNNDGLSGRMGALDQRLKLTEDNLSGDGEKGKSLAAKIARLEAILTGLEEAARVGEGGQLAGLTAVTKELKNSSSQTEKLKTEFIKMREEQSSFRDGLSSVRSKQADFIAKAANISDEMAQIRNTSAQIIAKSNRPPDVSNQLNPVIQSLVALQTKINGLEGRESGARAEGRNIALALALGELKRAVAVGTTYRAALERVMPHVPTGVDLTALANNADNGLINQKALQKTFAVSSRKALQAENVANSGGSLVDQLMAGAKSMVQVRPTGLVDGDDTSSVLSRMEFKLGKGNIKASLEQGKGLRGEAKTVMQPWLTKARTRLDGTAALRSLEDKIRNSLAGADSQ